MEFFLAVLALELTPGPNMAYLATLALSRGRVAGLYAVAGVVAGLAVHALIAALGLGTLIEKSPMLYETLRWAGVAYLLFLAWEGWQTKSETSPGRADLGMNAGPLFLRGFLSNIFNPKSILFFISVVPGFILGESGSPPIILQMALLGFIYVAVATIIHATIVILAVQLRPWLVEGPRFFYTRRALSLALAGIALWLAWSTQR